jgi:hypothetical protein
MGQRLTAAFVVALGLVASTAFLILASVISAGGRNPVIPWVGIGIILALIWYDILYHVRLVIFGASPAENREPKRLG